MTSTNPGAGVILDEAKRLLCQERTAEHGDTIESFKLIAEWWQSYLRAANTERHGVPLGANLVVDATDVAQLMSLLKKVRFLFGDHMNPENFIDDAGYVSMSGMFLGVKPTRHIPEPEPEAKQTRAAGMLNKIDLRAVEDRMRGAAE